MPPLAWRCKSKFVESVKLNGRVFAVIGWRRRPNARAVALLIVECKRQRRRWTGRDGTRRGRTHSERHRRFVHHHSVRQVERARVRLIDGALRGVSQRIERGKTVGGVTHVHVHLTTVLITLSRGGVLFLVFVSERGERRHSARDVLRRVRLGAPRRRRSVPRAATHRRSKDSPTTERHR